MADRRVVCGVMLLAAVLLARVPAFAGGAAEACCQCNCSGNITQCVTSFNCALLCFNMGCAVATENVCAVGVFAGCDSGCNAICNPPPATPSQTPTATSTGTPTGTPVPNGGSCMDTAQCAPGLVCVNNICSPTGAPASSPRGLAIAAGLLALIAAFALRRRRA